MKKMNIVRNTITEGTETYREKSRIGSINHRIWSVIAPMLLVVFGLFGVNVNVWAGRTHTGQTAVAAGKGTATVKIHYRKYATDAWNKRTGNEASTTGSSLVSATYERGNTQDGSIAFYATNSVTGYTFSGWYSDENCTSLLSNDNPYIAEGKNVFTSGVTKIAYAKFTPTDVTFNANGGSVTPSSKTVTDGSTYGALPVPTRDNYTFLNWYTEASSGTVVTASTTVTNKANHTLYAHWTPNYTITLTAGSGTTSAGTTSITVALNLNNNLTSAITTPTKAKNVFDGYYTGVNGTGTQIIDAFGNIIASAGGGSTYTDANKKWKYAGNIELYAKWISKYDFEITGGNYTINNEAWNKTEAFTFVHADVNHMTTTIEHGDVISYNQTENKITALKIGTSKITFTQNTSSTVNNGSIVFTITVDSVANTLTASPSYTCYVDTANFANIISNKNSNATVTTTSTAASIAYYNVSENKIYVPNSEAKSFTDTTVTIHIKQTATGKYKAVDKAITLTVKKRPNTLYANGSDNYSVDMYVDRTQNVTLTATNTDYTNSPISVEQIVPGDSTIAKYAYSQASHSGTVTSRQFINSSNKWRFTQPENYKYLAGENTFEVVVKKLAEATDCYVLDDENTYNWGTYGEKEYNFTERGVKLFYEIQRTAILGFTDNVAWNLYYYDAQGNELKKISLSVSNKDKWYSFTEDTYFSDKVRSVKFASEGGAAGNHFVRNVKVTRETWLNVGTDNSAINGTLTINKKADGVSAIYPGEKGQKSTTVYWSIANGGNLKIKCDDPRFSFSQSTITGVDCNSGTTAITVYYSDTVVGTATATATVYNDVYNQTFTVKGIIEKAKQPVTWNYNVVRYNDTITDAVSATVSPVTYESANPNIIKVIKDNLNQNTILVAVDTGTVNITAHVPGNAYYAAVDTVHAIKVTMKQLQTIVWNQSLFDLESGGDNRTLTATATSDVEGCISTRLVEYVSSNSDVVYIAPGTNVLQIKGVGTATVTAFQRGGWDIDGHEYDSVAVQKTAIVRDPDAPCDKFVYQQPSEYTFGNMGNLVSTETKSSTEIDFGGRVAGESSIYFKGIKRGITQYYGGTMSVEQYLPAASPHWQTVKSIGTPSTDGYDSVHFVFSREATKMRVTVTNAKGEHVFRDCQIKQARFIETTTPTKFTLNVGQTQDQTIYLSYSNVVGNISFTLGQGENSSFSVNRTIITDTCGGHAKNVAVVITYNPQHEVQNEQDVLTITDGTTSCQVVLTGSATRVNRHINWDHADETDIYTVQTETLSAEARTDLNELAGVVTFSLASSSTAAGAISMENVLSFTSAGVANVVAYTTDDARYNAAPNVTKVFNVSKTPTTISTLPVLAAVTSGTAVGDVELTGWQVTNTVNGGVVDGTLAITSADLINVGTNTVTLTFTPSNTDMYVGCTSTTTIVVNKATSVATPSAANIVYGQKVKESELSNVGTDGTWAWNTENNEAVLDAGTHEGLAVHFKPTSGNYTELDATVTLTVNKATPVVTAQASAITYGQAISASELSTATGNVSGSWAWAVDEEQVLSVGNHALKANFTSTNANYSDLSNVDVTLKVNKIEKLEVPMALSFCAGSSVNFHGKTYTEAGEYQIEAEGATRDTVYNVTVTELQPTAGTDSKTITVGANESWNGIGLSGYAVGSHEVVFHTENVTGCDSTVTLTLTVVPATNIFTNATENGDWDDPANWQSGIVPTGDPNIFVTGDLIIDEDITVGSLTIESTGSVAVISGGTLTVNGTSEARIEYGDVHVMSDGALALGNAANLQVRDFTLDAALGNSSNAATSGQVSGDIKLHINRDAYFQMSFDPSGAIDYGWYDFTVPFEVEVLNGVYDNNMNKLTNGVDYIAMNFNEERRASSGKGWGSFTGTMQPGRIYSIGFDETKTWNTFIFKKKSGSYLLSNGSFTAECSNVGAADDRGWNGLGNGTLQHRELTSLNGEKVQVYNHSEDRYEAYDADEKAYAVGTAFFVQADANMGTIDLTTTDGTKALRAPKYEVRELEEFRLTLTAEGDDRYADRMWVSASDDATGEYVIGHDLLKMGTPKNAKVAQMWTVSNDLRLCDIEMPLINDMSQCPLMFFAPNALTYEIAVDQAPEDATLYLTYNDRIIWSLSASPYTIDLEKGMTEGYGLRIVARHHSPSVATGMDELNVDQDGNRKVLIDNMLYIITPEGAMYSVTGEKVK